jgi:hypothetical protein
MLLAQQPQPSFDDAPRSVSGGDAHSTFVNAGQSGIDRPRQGWGYEQQLVGKSSESDQADAAESLISAIRRLMEQRAGETGSAAVATDGGHDLISAPENRRGGWESRLSAIRERGADLSVAAAQASSSAGDINEFATRIAMASQNWAGSLPEESAVAELPVSPLDSESSRKDAPSIRVDSEGELPQRPRLLDYQSGKRRASLQTVPERSLANSADASARHVDEQAVAVRAVVAKPLFGASQRPAMKPVPVSITEVPEGEDKPKHGRPAGWLVSTMAHVVGLLALGLFTLANPKPKDQLAFTASVSEASETVVESVTIESAEEMPDVSEPTPTETAADVSPLGTMRMAEVSLDLPTAVAPPMTTAMSGEMSSESMKLAKSSVKGDTLSKVQFAGLDGGGNHFVYLVDSSNSMKKFNDARTELLRSIDSLKPDQRFYVVFYDENPKYMRVTSPSQSDSSSVYATPENKQAMRRWAMAVQQARGQSPPDVLKFAFKLRPDVIFLLSDGEFTAQTETVIRENNRQENLFGESGPISIIHTIRYPGVSTTEGRQAEVQMQRIAAENGGQYRNVEIK